MLYPSFCSFKALKKGMYPAQKGKNVQENMPFSTPKMPVLFQ